MDMKKLQDDIKFFKWFVTEKLNSIENELKTTNKSTDIEIKKDALPELEKILNDIKASTKKEETCCCNCEECNTESEDIMVGIEVICDDEELGEFVNGYISEGVPELVEEAVEAFYDDDFDDDDECESELEFELIRDDDENINGVVMINNCEHCGRTVMNIFSNGDSEIEEIAKDMGFRD